MVKQGVAISLRNDLILGAIIFIFIFIFLIKIVLSLLNLLLKVND